MILAALALLYGVPEPVPTPTEAPIPELAWGIPPPVAPYGHDPLPSERAILPLLFPVLGTPRWADGFGEERGGFLHTGIDIRGSKMTPVIAPIAGTLGMKTMSFWIKAESGWQVLGTHLNDDNLGKHDHKAGKDFMFAPDLYPGMHVHSGQFIGYLGESGDATAPHLHFEIYAPGDGPIQTRIRNPFPSLKAAQIIKAPVVQLPNPKNVPPKGQVRLQGCIRHLDSSGGTVTMILFAKQTASGLVTAITIVRYLTVHVPPAVVEKAGGWDWLKQVPPEGSVALYLSDGGQLEKATVSRIDPPGRETWDTEPKPDKAVEDSIGREHE